MGTCKQLLPLAGKPAILHCLEAVLGSGVEEVVVVVGACGDDVAAAIGHLPVRIACNRDADADMAGSVRVGLAALEGSASGVMILLADQPRVAQGTCRRLREEHGKTPEAILIPVHGGAKGHPTVFPYRLLHPFPRGMTLRGVIDKYQGRVRLLESDDPGVVADMDTPADYRAMRESFAVSAPSGTGRP